MCSADGFNLKTDPTLEFSRNGERLARYDGVHALNSDVQLRNTKRGPSRDHVSTYSQSYDSNADLPALPAGTYSCTFSEGGPDQTAAFTSTGPSEAIQGVRTCPRADAMETDGRLYCGTHRTVFAPTDRVVCSAFAVDQQGKTATGHLSGGTTQLTTTPVTLPAQVTPMAFFFDATGTPLGRARTPAALSFPTGRPRPPRSRSSRPREGAGRTSDSGPWTRG